MTEEQPTEEVETTAQDAQGGDLTAEEAELVGEGTGDGDKPSEDDPATTIEKLQKELAAVKDEAAKRRIREKELAEKLAAAKDPEEVAKITAEHERTISSLEAELLKRTIADEVGIPSSLAARLQGATEEELRADAESLKELVVAKAPTPRTTQKPGGGLKPKDEDKPFDPEAYAKWVRQNRQV